MIAGTYILSGVLLIGTGSLFRALSLGAVMMILGGIAEVILGIGAEGRSLESIARPLTVAEEGAGSTVSGGVRAATAGSS